MRPMLGAALVGLVLVTVPALAQDRVDEVDGRFAAAQGIHPAYAAPGLYGMAYGYAGYGSVRTYSAFSSPYGPGYGYGYAPYVYLPGPWGVGLWGWLGFVAPGYVPSAGFYRTFPVSFQPWASGPTPPVGLYASVLGRRPIPGEGRVRTYGAASRVASGARPRSRPVD